ncbi:MAG: carboxypeptidase regulatory-like domain-containing protein [Flavobacteriales bacterium]|nr:carboxypeptidase regulatory-like domain-containing protein [Flavobacteriales bacterium]
MQRLLLLLLFAVVAMPCPAQLIGLSGVVVDHSTSEPVPFAHVYLHDRSHVAEADPDGRFTLTGLAPGTYTCIVEAIDYERGTFPGVELSHDKRWVRFELNQVQLIGGPPVITVKRRGWPWRWFVR